MFKSISLHPRLAAFIDALINAVMLWWLLQIGVWWMLFVWVFFRILLWAMLIRLVYYPPEVSRLRHFFSLLIFCLGALSTMLFIDWRYVWYLLGAFFIFFPLISFWLLPPVEDKLFLMSKHHRRWLFLMNVFGLGGLWNGLTAVVAFKILDISLWFWLVPTVAIATAVAIWWWQEYGLERGQRFWFWTIAFALVMLEVGWVILLNPLGNFVQGLLLIWVWYVLWLVARFYLSKEGIDWRKQKWFLGINLLLIIIFLVFLARWK